MVDYVSLFSPGGNARDYFRQATGNAHWVESFCDGLVVALQDKRTYFCSMDPLATMLETMAQSPPVRGVTCWRTSEANWQASYVFDGYSTAHATTRGDINEAVTTMLKHGNDRFAFMREAMPVATGGLGL